MTSKDCTDTSLDDRVWAARLRTAQVLAQKPISPDAVPALVAALQDEHPKVRAQAAISLGCICDFSTVAVLIQALDDEDCIVRYHVVKALDRLGVADPARHSEVLSVFNPMFGDTDERVGFAASLALMRVASGSGTRGERAEDDGLFFEEWKRESWELLASYSRLCFLGDTSPLPPIDTLIQGLQDGNADERQRAAEALARLSDPQAVPALVEALGDEHPSVRRAASQALGFIGAPEAVPALIEALGNERVSGVPTSIISALGRIGDARSVKPLIQLLQEKGKGGNDLQGWRIVEALSQIDDERVLPALIQTIDTKDGLVRYRMIKSLGELGDPKAIPVLSQILVGDEEDEMREVAVRSLRKIRHPQAVDALIQALTNDRSWKVRAYAVKSLAEIKDPGNVFSSLSQAAQDKKWCVSLRALAAMMLLRYRSSRK